MIFMVFVCFYVSMCSWCQNTALQVSLAQNNNATQSCSVSTSSPQLESSIPPSSGMLDTKGSNCLNRIIRRCFTVGLLMFAVYYSFNKRQEGPMLHSAPRVSCLFSPMFCLWSILPEYLRILFNNSPSKQLGEHN